MKAVYLVLIAILFVSCNDKTTVLNEARADTLQHKIIVPQFQKTIDSAGVNGSILVYSLADDTYYSNDYKWSEIGRLPASTFKIANSIIALETGVVENDSTLFKWNGEERRLSNWEQDLIFKEAFHFSCVPCYQEVAREIGAKRMSKYLDKLDYGNMKVDSTNIDLFWLEGASQINQFQQISFLKKFYQSELPISQRTEKIMRRMMVIEENKKYKLSGKTGWSIRNGNNNGWFVGYVIAQQKVYFFATNVEPKEQFEMNQFPMIRKAITYKALEALKII
ncbi:class D beta-lactamase [Rasiella rasia]|uniref:Beta-lactamase n=1 Tax=Rasiella rasia TaxID=2744027 RepID=A0A6G6GJQ6_9FLAO|nr:class D beta-lactamase [Rasiella rasia]QIE58757.1 class D beta-lactamase [Rasiella rasia]